MRQGSAYCRVLSVSEKCYLPRRAAQATATCMQNVRNGIAFFVARRATNTSLRRKGLGVQQATRRSNEMAPQHSLKQARELCLNAGLPYSILDTAEALQLKLEAQLTSLVADVPRHVALKHLKDVDNLRAENHRLQTELERRITATAEIVASASAVQARADAEAAHAAMLKAEERARRARADVDLAEAETCRMKDAVSKGEEAVRVAQGEATTLRAECVQLKVELQVLRQATPPDVLQLHRKIAQLERELAARPPPPVSYTHLTLPTKA